MNLFYDGLETRSNDERNNDQLRRLKSQFKHAKDNSVFYRQLFDGDMEINDISDLAKLPITRKSDLLLQQKNNPPFGGLNAMMPKQLLRVFASPGPIYDPEGHGRDWWRMGRAIYAAGFNNNDIAINCFSYHHTPAGHMMETGAHAVGCVVYPGGVGQTDAQVEAICHYKINGYMGTPDFLKNILDKAADMGRDISCLNKAFVSGGALFPSMRDEYNNRGISVIQAYGTADLGLIAYETPAQDGMVIDEGVIVEIIRAGTNDQLPDGEVGEVVVTLLDNRDYPLIRFATGDLSAIMDGVSPCGRSNKRLKGWMGRADQRTKVKGMFIDPIQIDRIVKGHNEIIKARLDVELVDNADKMTLKVEIDMAKYGDDQQILANITESLQKQCKIKGKVEFINIGELANDGLVINDLRKYD